MAQILRDNKRENSITLEFTCKIGDKVSLKNDYLTILRKSERQNKGPFTIKEVHKNGTLTITDDKTGTTRTLSICRVNPFFE